MNVGGIRSVSVAKQCFQPSSVKGLKADSIDSNSSNSIVDTVSFSDQAIAATGLERLETVKITGRTIVDTVSFSDQAIAATSHECLETIDKTHKVEKTADSNSTDKKDERTSVRKGKMQR